jgi:hypothetical protein
MTRYLPARQYRWFGMAAIALAAASGWYGVSFPPALLAAALFLLTGVALLVLAFQPAIELREGCLSLGRRVVPWMDIRRLDRTCWISPLVVRITLFDDSCVRLVYPGDLDSCNSLLRHLRRFSRDAMIDGVPYRQYWGEMLPNSGERKQPVPQRYRLLRAEDEAEVERLYQRLKTVGNLDQKNSADEK